MRPSWSSPGPTRTSNARVALRLNAGVAVGLRDLGKQPAVEQGDGLAVELERGAVVGRVPVGANAASGQVGWVVEPHGAQRLELLAGDVAPVALSGARQLAVGSQLVGRPAEQL